MTSYDFSCPYRNAFGSPKLLSYEQCLFTSVTEVSPGLSPCGHGVSGGQQRAWSTGQGLARQWPSAGAHARGAHARSAAESLSAARRATAPGEGVRHVCTQDATAQVQREGASNTLARVMPSKLVWRLAGSTGWSVTILVRVVDTSLAQTSSTCTHRPPHRRSMTSLRPRCVTTTPAVCKFPAA